MKKQNKKTGMFKGGRGPKGAFLAMLFVATGFFLLLWLTDFSRTIQVFSYSSFLDKVENNLVQEVYVDGQEVRGIMKDGQRFESVVAERGPDWDLLRSHGVAFAVANQAAYLSYWYLIGLIFILIIILSIWYFLRQSRGLGGGGGSNSIFTVGKSRARMFMPSMIKDRFSSVAGAREAKEELADIIDFLRNPKKYERLGARITRGALLIGEPGNGKTLLARAVAGEANCPFFSISGSDFIEVFVGVGAARVRDLFAQARKHAPCIIFIDEIDAVGRHRGSGMGGGNDEREQTLNQLLSEMDGFQTTENPVIVLAATNRLDVLDKALLRPGRFDRQIVVPFPDLKSRQEILAVHAKPIKMDDTVDLKKIARGTPGFSGADLANLLNESAIIASRENSDLVNVTHVEEARDKIILGKEVKSILLSDKEREMIAYHESGHALVRLLMPEHADPLHKVTIIPRGRALGVTHSIPEREQYIRSQEEVIASVMAALGGRAAEEIIFNTLTTGAASDLQAATNMVRSMVCDYGMRPEDVGLVQYSQREGDFVYSQKSAEKIDDVVKQVIDQCYEKAKELLHNNQDKLGLLAKALLEKETLYAAEIYALLSIEPREGHRFV